MWLGKVVSTVYSNSNNRRNKKIIPCHRWTGRLWVSPTRMLHGRKSLKIRASAKARRAGGLTTSHHNRTPTLNSSKPYSILCPQEIHRHRLLSLVRVDATFRNNNQPRRWSKVKISKATTHSGYVHSQKIILWHRLSNKLHLPIPLMMRLVVSKKTTP